MVFQASIYLARCSKMASRLYANEDGLPVQIEKFG